uniref:Gustatory receptor n=1 Tax=Anopheles albimanus TaxID=7167 RepID=A0A1Y9G9L1_ANOAL
MAPMVQRYCCLLTISAWIYLVPCSYCPARKTFLTTYRNAFAFMLASVFFASYMTIDFWFVRESLRRSTPVMLGLLCLDTGSFAVLLPCLTLNGFYHRKRFIRLFNALFTREEWMLDWVTNGVGAHPIKHGRFLLAVIVIYLIYYVVPSMPSVIRLQNLFVLMRFCANFGMMEIYCACVETINLRMKQLMVLFPISATATLVPNPRDSVFDRKITVFFDRYKHYQQQIVHINKCFSLPLLNSMLIILVELSFTCFDVFHGNDIVDLGLVNFTIRQIIQLVFVFMMVRIATVSHSAAEQVEETARCTRYFDDYRLQNTRAAKQVQKFLLKNLHQKKKFSACGFFDIDNTVIYMVFSSIVTYLVILIQFKQLENDLTQPVPYNGTANGTTEAP